MQHISEILPPVLAKIEATYFQQSAIRLKQQTEWDMTLELQTKERERQEKRKKFNF